ncbi:endonuclease 8-like 1 isoform X2 [Enhydra lutris kenyoni]|uniref:Endonuclease 8-like 1 isoform X2 n=1 Tax=Enhydra lutris kenyoni TaxID=391180 RepID=A0A2Y9K2Q7_ENHLU|nr:endonuclease 8-like 1 isoform X2 [Enhydra lutris kenyoni]
MGPPAHPSQTLPPARETTLPSRHQSSDLSSQHALRRGRAPTLTPQWLQTGGELRGEQVICGEEAAELRRGWGSGTLGRKGPGISRGRAAGQGGEGEVSNGVPTLRKLRIWTFTFYRKTISFGARPQTALKRGTGLAPRDALPAHAHLRFYTAPPGPPLALCFVDIRRFGHWDLGGEWQPGRGPCVLLEYEQFRENVLRNLVDKVFDQPICEALLDQRFFNGIGNYLRAEILYRLRIPPFEKARKVLEELQQRRPSPELTLSQKIRAKLQNPDLLELCHSVPKEVVQLGGKGYGPEHGEEDFAAFRAWLQCYGVPGMSSLRDRRGRTIWFQGDPGPLAPKGGKSRKKKSKGAQQGPEHRLEPLPGHVGHAETLLVKVQPSSQRGPASSRTQRSRQSLGRERGGGDQQPQATADPEGSKLTPHSWIMRGRQPLSRKASCSAKPCGAWVAQLKQVGAAGGQVPWPCGYSLHNYDVFNCTPFPTF